MFWAKTTFDGKPGISVLEHLLNVGAVAQCLAKRRFSLLNPSVVGVLAALHDLGKISPGFQQKCKAWLENNKLEEIARYGEWSHKKETDHGKVSHAAIQEFLKENGSSHRAAKYVSAIIGGHHGRLNMPNDYGYRSPLPATENKSGINWIAERLETAKKVLHFFGLENINLDIDDSSPAFWWLAGLISVSDWIGSDERFFAAGRDETTRDVFAIADEAVESIGFREANVIPGLSFHDLFGDVTTSANPWIPNEMQEKAVSTIIGPGVYVIEAPMGIGKTEAAFWAAYNLLVSKKANGIYFALPTQATSNRIHFRMGDFISRISQDFDKVRLIHANSWLMDHNTNFHPTQTTQGTFAADARNGLDWFASAKRALLAPFGVGTVDQALLAVVAAKHFFVRHFALTGKVVILDEVHSYDLYTGTLIDKLITTLESLGCTVIILSATLTEKRRSQIVESPALPADSSDYPLITGRNAGQPLEPVSVTQPQSREIEVVFKKADVVTDRAIVCAKEGGCVLWICNTVDAAQKQFESFRPKCEGNLCLGLLHSRFTHWRREELENEWMERLGKKSAGRCGSILVSTQVVEQSVDLDSDLLVTELAPTDMLLQRVGRLWRHERVRQCVDKPQVIILSEHNSLSEFRQMSSEEILESLGGKAHVYDPFVLLRTLQVWNSCSTIRIPAQIRWLLENTYEPEDKDPPSWQELFDKMFIRKSNDKFKAVLNTNYWQPHLPDMEGVQTRLNEVPTIHLVLCHSLHQNNAVFLDGTCGELGGELFRLPIAQSIHRNVVKAPEYLFTKPEPNSLLSTYLRGSSEIGIVQKNGNVEVSGLEKGVQLSYSDKTGLVIIND